mgnify:CR=1 FL=1
MAPIDYCRKFSIVMSQHSYDGWADSNSTLYLGLRFGLAVRILTVRILTVRILTVRILTVRILTVRILTVRISPWHRVDQGKAKRYTLTGVDQGKAKR